MLCPSNPLHGHSPSLLTNGQRHASLIFMAGYDLAITSLSRDFVIPFLRSSNDLLHLVQGQRIATSQKKMSSVPDASSRDQIHPTSNRIAILGRGGFIMTRDVALLV